MNFGIFEGEWGEGGGNNQCHCVLYQTFDLLTQYLGAERVFEPPELQIILGTPILGALTPLFRPLSPFKVYMYA